MSYHLQLVRCWISFHTHTTETDPFLPLPLELTCLPLTVCFLLLLLLLEYMYMYSIFILHEQLVIGVYVMMSVRLSCRPWSNISYWHFIRLCEGKQGLSLTSNFMLWKLLFGFDWAFAPTVDVITLLNSYIWLHLCIYVYVTMCVCAHARVCLCVRVRWMSTWWRFLL